MDEIKPNPKMDDQSKLYVFYNMIASDVYDDVITHKPKNKALEKFVLRKGSLAVKFADGTEFELIVKKPV